MPRAKSEILSAVHETATGLHSAGAIGKATMREFDTLCLKPVKPLSARQIQQLRVRARASQAVFAAYLNTSLSAVQKWETGKKKPSGPALKLLHLVASKGLDFLNG